MNKSYLNFRTDMADERVDTYKRVNNMSDIDGVIVKTKEGDEFRTTTVDITNDNGSKALSKQIGTYVTMELDDVLYMNDETKQKLLQSLAGEISNLIGNDKNKSILVVGLGNIAVTPDSLGPKVTSYLDITRHVIKYAKEYAPAGAREVSCLAPGVLGTTGIETSEIIRSVVNDVKPDIVIAIDSLASMSVHRIGSSIQLSNTGITPGSGVKNKREGINQESLNIPVIAIGIPTVVDMATITNEAIDKLVETIKNEANNYPNQPIDKEKLDNVLALFEQDDRYNMIANTLNTENYMVTPKEIDDIVAKVSEIIASGINIAMQA